MQQVSIDGTVGGQAPKADGAALAQGHEHWVGGCYPGF